MLGEIIKAEVIFVGIDLPKPFPLAFGTLFTLPRVFLVLSFLGKNSELQSIGEASIDFPFSHYDAWDIYSALSSLQLVGRNVFDRESLLIDPTIRRVLEFPAAFAAVNMALDDAFGKLNAASIPSLYGAVRDSGLALESIAMPSTASELGVAFSRVVGKGNVPKLKGGQGLAADWEFIKLALRLANTEGASFAIDFNAAYTRDEFATLIYWLYRLHTSTERILFFEQPTKTLHGLVAASKELKRSGMYIPIMADESFVTRDDALFCHGQGILLNYKIQKLGGIAVAREIEEFLGSGATRSMVGGTFPTAIGRVWDQYAACVLHRAELPSDGWQPSTDWFEGNRHIIFEQFPKGRAIVGNGLGVTIRWDLLRIYTIADPHTEYGRIREGRSGDRIRIQLKKGQCYPKIYQELTGRSPQWNL